MKIRTPLFLGAMALVMSGCGGGSSSLLPANGIIPFYFTQEPSAKYSHVFVKIYSISILSNIGRSTVVLDDPNGFVVDVGALKDSSGALFKFYKNLLLPQNGFIRFDVVMSQTITFMNTAGGTSNLQITNELTAGPGKVLLRQDIRPPFEVESGGPFAIDFPVSKWAIKPAGVAFTVDIPTSAPVDASKQAFDVIEGTTSAVFGPLGTENFNLKSGNSSFKVTTTPDTVILRADGGASPTLANGQTVHVTGTFANGSLAATRVMIDGAATTGIPDAHGTFSNVSAQAGSFTLAFDQSNGILPSDANLQVISNSSTAFFSPGGVPEPKAQFFAELSAQPAGSSVLVQGALNNATMTAKAIYQLPAAGQQHKIMAGGTVSNINATTATMSLKVHSFLGATLYLNSPISVIPNPAATFEINGQSVTQSQWIAAVTPGVTDVRIFGYLNGNTYSATRFAIGTTATDNGDAGDTL